MQTVVGTWRLTKEVAWDQAGFPAPTLYGPMTVGLISFASNGRMMAVLADGRPEPQEGQRLFASYCGAYTVEGSRIAILVDGASDSTFLHSNQIRDAVVDGNKMVLRPPVGFLAANDVTREFFWERIACD